MRIINDNHITSLLWFEVLLLQWVEILLMEFYGATGGSTVVGVMGTAALMQGCFFRAKFKLEYITFTGAAKKQLYDTTSCQFLITKMTKSKTISNKVM
ncbi:hypothetical protein C5167_045036, partial [Papaver somniferum]